jgi:hypothetical protein
MATISAFAGFVISESPLPAARYLGASQRAPVWVGPTRLRGGMLLEIDFLKAPRGSCVFRASALRPVHPRDRLRRNQSSSVAALRRSMLMQAPRRA